MQPAALVAASIISVISGEGVRVEVVVPRLA